MKLFAKIFNSFYVRLTTQKTKFFIKDFSARCDRMRWKTGDLVTFTGEILNGKLHFFCSDWALNTPLEDCFTDPVGLTVLEGDKSCYFSTLEKLYKISLIK